MTAVLQWLRSTTDPSVDTMYVITPPLFILLGLGFGPLSEAHYMI